MYNRYLTTAQQHEPEPPAEPGTACSGPAASAGGLLGTLTQRLSGFRIDADTLIVLAVVWFVLSEQDGEMDTELLIAIGVLLLLGI